MEENPMDVIAQKVELETAPPDWGIRYWVKPFAEALESALWEEPPKQPKVTLATG